MIRVLRRKRRQSRINVGATVAPLQWGTGTIGVTGGETEIIVQFFGAGLKVDPANAGGCYFYALDDTSSPVAAEMVFQSSTAVANGVQVVFRAPFVWNEAPSWAVLIPERWPGVRGILGQYAGAPFQSALPAPLFAAGYNMAGAWDY